MSISTRNPLRVLGGNANSGNINTQEQIMTLGGGQALSIYSGAVAPGLTGAPGAVATGSDVLLVSGAGRLKDVIPHVQISGVQTVFYDAAVVSSGGPFALSGHKILGVIPANTWGGGPAGTLFGAGPSILGFDMPFQSGLCVASKSGQAGFSLSYFPETNQNFG